MIRKLTVPVVVLALLSACASDLKAPPLTDKVAFIDTTSFDRSLTSSLGANLDKVEIPVEDKMTPTAIPERLNKWLSAVDANGGSVKVKPVEEPGGKSRAFPVAVIGVAFEVARYLYGQSAEKIYQPAANYDAEIFVRQSPSGERIIEKVILHRKDAK